MKPGEKDARRLGHMLDAAREIVQFAGGRDRECFHGDRKLVLATLALLMTIGEAASRVSPPFQAAHEEINWPGIVSARHRLVHGYDAVNLDIVWDLVSQHEIGRAHV